MTHLKTLLLIAATVCAVFVTTSGNNEFRLESLSIEYKGRNTRRVIVTVKFTAPSKPDNIRCEIFHEGAMHNKNPNRFRFRDNKGEVLYVLPTNLQLAPIISFTFPEAIFVLRLRPIMQPPATTDAIPDVHFEPEGDFTYARSGDASVDVTVFGGEGVNQTGLSYTSYVKDGAFFRVSEDWPITIVEAGDAAAAAGGGGGSSQVYRLEFNTTQQRPEGILLLKASVAYSSEGGGPKLIQAIEVEKRVDFYQEGSTTPVTSDTLALVRTWTDYGFSAQLCDLSVSQPCVVTCAAVGNVSMMMIEFRDTKLHPVTSTSMGFLTVTSAPLPDVKDTDEVLFGCTAFGRNTSHYREQVIKVRIRQQPDILEDDSAAILHPNQTLEVRCKAKGHPMPTITISAADDPDGTPLEERFPNESRIQVMEAFRQVSMWFWLSKPSFTSTLSQVRCTASNVFKEPDVLLLDVVQA